MRLWYRKGAWASKRAKKLLDNLEPADINSIGVIRHAAVGDMILVRAFIFELKKCFPNAKITLSIVSNYTRGAPSDMVDRVHVAYGSDHRKVPIREQIRRTRELGYHDIIFDLAVTTRSIWLCVLNKAKLKISFPYHNFQRHLFYDIAVLRTDLKFEAEVMIDMLSVLGFKTDFPPRFCVPGEALVHKRPYLTYFTGASISYKCWPANNFAHTIKRLSELYPYYDHIILEGIETWESIDSILKEIGDKPNVKGMKMADLESTISLLKGSTLLLANDTGIRNLAIATETPTVGIFFFTEPYRYWPRYGRHDAVFNYDGSVPSVDAVIHSVQSMLNKTNAV